MKKKALLAGVLAVVMALLSGCVSSQTGSSGKESIKNFRSISSMMILLTRGQISRLSPRQK